MALSDDDALLAIAPELSSETPDRRAFFLDAARSRVSASLGQTALAYAAAHAMALAPASGGGGTPVSGPLVKEKEYGLERDYAPQRFLSTVPEYWSRTNYGQAYWEVVVSTTVGPMNRFGDGDFLVGGYVGGPWPFV